MLEATWVTSNPVPNKVLISISKPHGNSLYCLHYSPLSEVWLHISTTHKALFYHSWFSLACCSKPFQIIPAKPTPNPSEPHDQVQSQRCAHSWNQFSGLVRCLSTVQKSLRLILWMEEGLISDHCLEVTVHDCSVLLLLGLWRGRTCCWRNMYCCLRKTSR